MTTKLVLKIDFIIVIIIIVIIITFVRNILFKFSPIPVKNSESLKKRKSPFLSKNYQNKVKNVLKFIFISLYDFIWPIRSLRQLFVNCLRFIWYLKIPRQIECCYFGAMCDSMLREKLDYKRLNQAFSGRVLSAWVLSNIRWINLNSSSKHYWFISNLDITNEKKNNLEGLNLYYYSQSNMKTMKLKRYEQRKSWQRTKKIGST